MAKKSFLFVVICVVVSSFYGCAGKNEVLFVTNTSYGIDIGAKPPAVNIAYDRTEGYFAPRYENGALPPVAASIQSDVGTFSLVDPGSWHIGTRVSQLYATGAAANLLVDRESATACAELKRDIDMLNYRQKGLAVKLQACEKDSNENGDIKACKDSAVYEADNADKKVMFFGTSSTIVMKIGFAPEGYPDSGTIGYKRSELSYIPLGNSKKDDNGVTVYYDVYPSVIASINSDSKSARLQDTNMKNDQFFDTGCAAEKLAAQDYVREMFKGRAKDSYLQYVSAVSEQDSESSLILACYAGVNATDAKTAWRDADRLELFSDKNLLNTLNSENDKQKANSKYAREIANHDGAKPERADHLKLHRLLVCGMVPQQI